jgi:hypothetical protein
MNFRGVRIDKAPRYLIADIGIGSFNIQPGGLCQRNLLIDEPVNRFLVQTKLAHKVQRKGISLAEARAHGPDHIEILLQSDLLRSDFGDNGLVVSARGQILVVNNVTAWNIENNQTHKQDQTEQQEDKVARSLELREKTQHS